MPPKRSICSDAGRDYITRLFERVHANWHKAWGWPRRDRSAFFWAPMQMYLADCVFPEIEGQLAAYTSFCELWDSGEMAKLDNFDGFEMLVNGPIRINKQHD